MNISTSISSISLNSLQNNKVNSEKIYVWPHYNAGKVEKIQSITRKTDSDIYYTKPLPEEKDKLLFMAKTANQEEYTAEGISHKTIPLKPGSLFEALA